MCINRSEKSSFFNCIFFVTIFQLIVLNIQSVDACYAYQDCLTPRNYSGRYVTEANYEYIKDKTLCDGFRQLNSTSTRLRCCAYDATVQLERISKKTCEFHHLKRNFIIKGKLAKDNEFPFMAALGWRVKDELSGNWTIVYKCGGTIYERGYVLTAAHCLYHSSDLPVVVRPGGFALNDTEAWDLEIEEVIEHPNYEYPSAYNDIAIIRLKTEFYGNPFHDAPACLWDKPTVEGNVTVIGYGDTQYAGVSSPLLMKTNLTTIHNDECKTHYEPDSGNLCDGIISTQICAKDKEEEEEVLRDTCQGDSGGPLIKFIWEEDIYYTTLYEYVVGITSFGIGCGTGAPGVYTRISEYIDWIENVTYRAMAE